VAHELWKRLTIRGRDQDGGVDVRAVAETAMSILTYLNGSVRLQRKSMSTYLDINVSDMLISIHAAKHIFVSAVERLTAPSDSSLDDPLARTMHAFLVRHHTQSISLADLARHCGMSEGHCSRTFGRLFGRSISRSLTEIRIERARRLLIETDSTIAEIAAAVGFRDAAYFSRVFHRSVGVSARDFRATHRI
jgi:AraC-like DNA-binding protein